MKSLVKKIFYLIANNKRSGLILFFIGPLALLIIYLYLMAPDRYLTHSDLIIEDGNIDKGKLNLLDGINFSNPNSNSDENILKSLVSSPSMVKNLDSDLEIRQHYSRGRDFIFGLAKNHTYEEFMDFYRKFITVSTNPNTGLLSLKVEAYTPSMSKKIAENIILHGEQFINNSNKIIARNEMGFALDEVNRSEALLHEAEAKLLSFQKEYNLVSPQTKGESLFSIITELEGELSKTMTQINEAENYLIDDAPKLRRLKAKASSITDQISKQKSRIIGSRDVTALNSLSSEYQLLIMNVEKLTSLHKSSIATYELARIQSIKKLKHLIVVSKPYLPEDSLYPKRLYWLVTGIIFLVIALGLFKLIKDSVSEHQD